MTVAASNISGWQSASQSDAVARQRDCVIDTMRGVAIVMVIGIHSLPKTGDSAMVIAIDAIFRPCVPIFLFASGYLSAQVARIPLGKRVKRLLGPYTIAFVVAYLFMALQNPSMDHRPAVAVARYVLAYVFVYYYVFVYFACTVALWLVFAAVNREKKRRLPLIAILSVAIVIGLTVGAYLEPVLDRLGLSAYAEEVRLRDIPFWFTFVAMGVIVGLVEMKDLWRAWRYPVAALTLAAYAFYAVVRIWHIGDAAAYDSAAFFLYSGLLCLSLLGFGVNAPALAALGVASYFIYLWHIFVIMSLRELPALQQNAAMAAVTEFAVALAVSAVAVAVIRRTGSQRLAQWLGV